MIKQLIAVFALFIFAATAASAASPNDPVTGKIVAIDGSKVQVTFEGEKPAWIRKGAVVKVANEAGDAIDNTARVSEVGDGSFTITTKRAADVNVGDSLSFQKGRASTGC